MTTCPSTNADRTCTRPGGHDPPHRDDLGAWVHISEYTPSEQAHIRSLWAEDALFYVFASGDDQRAKFHTLVEAMNYATAMARGGDAW